MKTLHVDAKRAAPSAAPRAAAARPIMPAPRAAATQLSRRLAPARRPAGAARRAPAAPRAAAVYGSEWATPPATYLCLGLAHCFEKGDDGKLADRFLIEPVSANSLEAMAAGAKTSFTLVFGTTLGAALARDRAALPADFAEARFCDEFETRCDSCARTWRRPHAVDNLLQRAPLGASRGGWQYDVTEKRVLNMVVEVNDDDNIKQDMSIDVYGRKGGESDGEDAAPKVAAAAKPAAAAAAAEESDDDLDGLLSG